MDRLSKASRWLIVCLSLILFLWVERQPTAAESPQPAAQTLDGVLMSGGQQRTFTVHLPPAYDDRTELPLVLVLHRGAYSGRQMERLTGFDALADQENFIAVYPDGIDGSWNDGLGLSFLKTVQDNTDDVGFIAALVDELSQQYRVDPQRIYAAGFSSGANLGYLLACQLPERFAGVALVGSLMLQKVADTCHPSMPISLMLIQGTADPLFAWEGGQFVVDQVDYGYQYSAAETLDFWLAADGCSAKHEMRALPDVKPEDGTRVWIEQYDNCDHETGIALYAVLDGGHNWSGVRSDLDASLTGKVSYDFDATTAIWQFFAAHPR